MKKYRSVWVLIISMFFMASAYTMLIPFLPLYLLELGVSQARVHLWTGLVFSSAFFVAGIMGPVWGKMADTQGKKRMAVRAAFLIGCSYFLGGIVHNEWQLLGMRIFQGFANGLVAASMAIISSTVEEKALGTYLGFAQTSIILGGICGPFMGGGLSHLIGMRDSFFVAALFLWLVTAAIVIFVREPAHAPWKKSQEGSIADDLRYARSNRLMFELLMAYFVLQGTIMMIQPVVTLYIGELQHSMSNVAVTAGTIMSCGGIAGALTTTFWGRLGQKKGYYRAICMTISGAGLGMLIQSIPDSIFWFGVCQAMVSCFIVGVNPSLNAALVKCTPESFRGRAFGLSNTAQQMGSMIGPLLSAGIMEFMPIYMVYILAGIVLLYLAWRMYQAHLHSVSL